MSKGFVSNLKIVSAFASAQFFEILFGLIRSKFAAIYIGVIGIGLTSLYNSPLGIIIAIGSLGINFVATKELSFLYKNQDPNLLNILGSFRCSIVFSAFVSSFITFIFSPILSSISIGDETHSDDFRLLSIFIFFTILTNGNRTINQSFREIRKNVLMSIWTTLLTSIITILLYFFYSTDGIVFSIVISSIVSFFISEIFIDSSFAISRFSFSQFKFNLFIDFVKQGVPMVLSNFLTSLSAYLVLLIILNHGNLQIAGYYSAGMAIIGQLATAMFIAMGTDYFPRLASQKFDSKNLSTEVNLQIKMSLFIIAPIVLGALILSKVIISIIYSEDFFIINEFVMISSLSLIFKSVSWSIAYILIANGDGKKVLLSELIFLVVNLISSYFGFINYGLTGLAYSNVLIYVLHLFYMYSITHKHYKFNLEPSTVKLFFFVLICCMLIFIVNILKFQNLFIWIKYCLILFVCLALARELSTLLKNK